jgi:hypothetical protein
MTLPTLIDLYVVARASSVSGTGKDKTQRLPIRAVLRELVHERSHPRADDGGRTGQKQPMTARARAALNALP